MSADRRAARPEVLADVSEWAAQELALALSITTSAAEALLTRSLTLVNRLPRTLAALEAGSLHVGHLWPLLDKVAPIANPKVRAEVESDLLEWAAGRVTTPAQLGAKPRRMVLIRDARGAAQRLTEALRTRGVSMRPGAADGMGAVIAILSLPEAQAFMSALGRLADALDDEADGPPRTRDQKMADCLMDLVLRSGETQLPVVQAQLTLVAPIPTMIGGDAPGESGGEPVSAEMVRAMAQAFGLIPQPMPPQQEPQPQEDRAPAASASDADMEDLVTVEFFDGDPWPDEAAAELEEWWTEVEARVQREWRGWQSPPPEVERAWLEQQARWDRMPAAADMLLDVYDLDRYDLDVSDLDVGLLDPDDLEARIDLDVPVDPAAHVEPGARAAPATTDGGLAVPDADGADGDATAGQGTGWWSAADTAVTEAGELLLGLERALSRASRAVISAETADAADENAWRQSPAGRMSAAPDSIAALAEATADQRAALAALLRRTGGGGLVDRPRIALTDALTGALLALTDARELCAHATCGRTACRRGTVACTHDLSGLPGLGPPGPSPTYRPGAALDRFLRARDRRCRFPGCRNRVPRGGELDHDVPWPDGPTAAGNLTGYCTAHHRGKHQAPGWRHMLLSDGTLTVTTPSGLTASTEPPPY